MNQLVIEGDVTSALSHFTALGVASIVDQLLGAEARVGIVSEPMQRTRCAVHTRHSLDAIGNAVVQHAASNSQEDSWVKARISGGSRNDSPQFVPRYKPPKDASEWRDICAQRSEWTREHDESLSILDERMLHGFGQPAWWRCDGKDNQPDAGASRWEMKTRNRGEDMVDKRMTPLAETVAQWKPIDVANGLSGKTCKDVVGKNKDDSRSSSGFRIPGPTDNAVAWCALWGMSAFPVVPRLGGMAQTPGAWPRRNVHPKHMVLPIFHEPVSVYRYRAVVTSEMFDLRAFCAERDEPDIAVVQQASAWLGEQGVSYLVKFPILLGGSSSAPERQVLSGEVELV